MTKKITQQPLDLFLPDFYFAGLYYYLGIILKVIHKEKQYKANEITPVYIGGEGSRLLNWLAIGGQFDRYAEVNELFSKMLSKASGFEDTNEITHISKRPQDEIACGLLLDKTPLGDINNELSQHIITGEDCKINGKTIKGNESVELPDNIKSFEIPELHQLSCFLDEFNQGLIDINADGLKPMSQFTSGEGLESRYKDKFWHDVQRKLTKTLSYIRGNSDNIAIEPPFILGLKALLEVLSKEWSSQEYPE